MAKLLYPCFVNTIPKSGTFLGEKLASLLGYEPAPGGFSYFGGDVADWVPPCGYEEVIQPDGSLCASEGLVASGRWAGVLETRARFFKIGDGVLHRMASPYMLFGHLLYAPSSAEAFAGSPCRMLLILRDPRGVAASYAAFAPRKAWLRELYRGYPPEERIRLSFLGHPPDHPSGMGIPPLVRRYRNMLNWLESDAVLGVRFEDLVGPRGGGSAERQRDALRSIIRHLGLGEWSASRVDALGSELFGGTRTFHVGHITGWRAYAHVFEEPQLAEAVAEILDLLDAAHVGLPSEPVRAQGLRSEPIRQLDRVVESGHGRARSGARSRIRFWAWRLRFRSTWWRVRERSERKARLRRREARLKKRFDMRVARLRKRAVLLKRRSHKRVARLRKKAVRLKRRSHKRVARLREKMVRLQGKA